MILKGLLEPYVKVATGKNISYWHEEQSQRIFDKILYVLINNERKKLYDDINKRCLKILKSSAILEVSKFLEQKKMIDHPLHKSIGLEILEKHINGTYNFEEAIDLFRRDTRRYAKRQITWFKNKSKKASLMNFHDARSYLLKNI